MRKDVKKIATLVVAIMMAMAIAPAAFAAHWAQSNMDKINEGTFIFDSASMADTNINRANMAKIHRKMYNLPYVAEETVAKDFGKSLPIFPDVNPGTEGYMEIIACYNAGLIKGYPNGCFGPQDPATRGNLAKIVSLYLQKDTYGKKTYPNKYTDTKGHYAEQDIAYLTERKVIHGYPDGSCKPDNKITYAEDSTVAVNSARMGEEAAIDHSCKLQPTPTGAPIDLTGGQAGKPSRPAGFENAVVHSQEPPRPAEFTGATAPEAGPFGTPTPAPVQTGTPTKPAEFTGATAPEAGPFGTPTPAPVQTGTPTKPAEFSGATAPVAGPFGTPASVQTGTPTKPAEFTGATTAPGTNPVPAPVVPAVPAPFLPSVPTE
jgi:hypothetical protein